MMTAFLPHPYAADAVPEKRTPGEEQMPPAAVQANEMLRRVEEQAKSEKQQGKTKQEPDPGEGPSSAEPSERPKVHRAKDESKRSRTKSSSDKKYGSARKGTHTEVNVFNISQSNGFHVGHNIEINNTWTGGPGGRTKPKDTPPDKRDVSPHSELPQKLFKSLKTVTKEDCIHVSEYSSCMWDELGELLFFEETSRLEQYRTEMERNSRKKAVQLILEEWRKFAGKNALVANLSRELRKLNEIEALKRLAKRHNL